MYVFKIVKIYKTVILKFVGKVSKLFVVNCLPGHMDFIELEIFRAVLIPVSRVEKKNTNVDNLTIFTCTLRLIHSFVV